MKKNLIAAGIIGFILIGGGLYLQKLFDRNPPAETKIEQSTLTLPDGWKKAESSQNYLVKVEKNDQKYKPQVVMSVNLFDDKDIAKYTDKLIRGVKVTLPRLKYLSDKTNNIDGNYERLLTGYYYNKNTKINLIQKLIAQENNLYVLTASYTDETSNSEDISKIFDVLWTSRSSF